jgi:hypothetical protein
MKDAFGVSKGLPRVLRGMADASKAPKDWKPAIKAAKKASGRKPATEKSAGKALNAAEKKNPAVAYQLSRVMRNAVGRNIGEIKASPFSSKASNETVSEGLNMGRGARKWEKSRGF